MSEWKKTWCCLCAVTCSLEMEVENGKIISVRPDPTSPRSNGYCCRKGRSAKYFVDHGDRVLYPRKGLAIIMSALHGNRHIWKSPKKQMRF